MPDSEYKTEQDVTDLRKLLLRQIVETGDNTVRAEVKAIMEDLKGDVQGLKDALIGYKNDLGEKVPGALEEIHARITDLQVQYKSDVQANVEQSQRQHGNWQEGEEIREKARIKRNEELTNLISSVAEQVGKLATGQQEIKDKVDDHEKRFVSRFSRTVAWCVKKYNYGHKKWVVLAAAWAATTTAIAAAVAVVMKLWSVFEKFSHLSRDVFHVIKGGLGK